MRKRTRLLILKKKKVFLIVGILSFLCLVFAIIFLLFYNYYPIESRIGRIEEYAKNDKEDYTTVGWLRVQGTNIDYPIIYAPSYDFSGMTYDFLWNEVKSDNLLNQITVSGHNILNLSSNPLVANENHKRFEQLMSFIYLDFIKDNKYIQYTANGNDYLYKIFSVAFSKKSNIKKFTREDLSREEMKEYLNQSLNDSIFEFDVDVDENDKILSLVTCTRMFGHYNDIEFKIDARLVRKGELKLNYGVNKTEKYHEIEKIMEGGENDEKV